MAVRRFWYHDSLSFNLARFPFYQPMIDVIAVVGPGYKGPSYSALNIGEELGEDLDEELQCIKE